MKTIPLILVLTFIACTDNPSSSNDFITNPPDPEKKKADIQILFSDIRLRFPDEIEMYVKIINYGPDPAFNVKATLPVFANDESIGSLIMSFREGRMLDAMELDKNTEDMPFDSSWNIQQASNVKYGAIVLSWETR